MAFPPITPLPVLASGTKPDANGELWNTSYLEIDANFDLLENIIPTEYWDGVGFSVPSGTGSANGHVIQDEGIGITQRANLDFIGASVVAADGGSASEITINGAVLAKNIESITANKTLTDASEPIQVLTPDAAWDVNLPAEAVTNPFFMITNPSGSGFTLTVKDDGAATITTVADGETKIIIPDGVTWYVLAGGGSTSLTTISELSHNLIKNFPSLELADGAAPLWWETTNATLTEEDATGETLSAPPNERVLKVVTSAINGLAQQTYLPADERLLSASNTVVSAGCWVYVTTAGTVKFSLYDSVGGEIASDATATTGSWIWLSVLAEAIGANTLYWRIEHSANAATFHFTNPILNTGEVVAPFASRGLVRKEKYNNFFSADPGGAPAGYQNHDLTVATSPLAVLAELNIGYQNTSNTNNHIRIRRNGDTGDTVAHEVVRNRDVVSIVLYNAISTLLSDAQILQYKSSALAADTENLSMSLRAFWEWK